MNFFNKFLLLYLFLLLLLLLFLCTSICCLRYLVSQQNAGCRTALIGAEDNKTNNNDNVDMVVKSLFDFANSQFDNN